MSPRFFVPPEQIQGNQFIVTGSEARHAALVLRKKVGDVLDLFDGKDLSFQGRIQSVQPERIEGVILQEVVSRQASSTSITLYQALIKGSRWDWLVEKACEIGATQLIPILSARTIVKPSLNGLERWKRIALAASKQSGRSRVMDVAKPRPFTEAVEGLSGEGMALIPWEKEKTMTVRSKYKKNVPISLFVGPEGGWENQEVDFARRKGVIPVTIGRTLLRSETAGLVALTQVLCEMGE
jgi:16S rRNA (uracil1498-N3)-methyltransferase